MTGGQQSDTRGPAGAKPPPGAAATWPRPTGGEPELTVIIPTRERPELLRATLYTVLASAAEAERTLDTRVRVLVVDDASPTDATRAVTEELGADYARVAVHDGFHDPGAAIILGVELTTSPYVAVFGDDDIMLPRHIPLHLAALRAGWDVSSPSYRLADQALAPIRDVVLPEPHLGDMLAGRIHITDGSFTRTELVRKYGLRAEHHAQLLYPLWTGAMIDGARFRRETEVTFLYRRHTANISDKPAEVDAELRRTLQAEHRALAAERLGSVPAPRPDPPEKLRAEARARRRRKLRLARRAARLFVLRAARKAGLRRPKSRGPAGPTG